MESAYCALPLPLLRLPPSSTFISLKLPGALCDQSERAVDYVIRRRFFRGRP
jgi:hypothetical protein